MNKKDYQLSINEDTFENLRDDFDTVLERTIGNMINKGAVDATVTLKLSISLTDEDGGNLDDNEITKPEFKHDISSVMQVKTKKSGSMAGEYKLVWDDDANKYVMRRIDNGQTSLFDEEDDVEYVNADDEQEQYEESGPALIEGNAESPFEFFIKFTGKEVKVQEVDGNYTVRTVDDDELVLSSAASSDSAFHCDEEVLKKHIGCHLVCVGYYNDFEDAAEHSDNDIVEITVECEDCFETIFHIERAGNGTISDDAEVDENYLSYDNTEEYDEQSVEADEGEDFDYDEPEE